MIEDEVVYDFLEHHGIRGMHWGVRMEKRKNRPPLKRGKGGTQARHDAAKKIALIAAGGVAAAIILRRVGLYILL